MHTRRCISSSVQALQKLALHGSLKLDKVTTKGTPECDDPNGSLCYLWITGDFLIIPTPQNCVMNELAQKAMQGSLRLQASIDSIGAQTSVGSKFRDIITATYARLTKDITTELQAPQFHKGVLHFILERVRVNGTDSTRWRPIRACDYHEHPKETGNVQAAAMSSLSISQSANSPWDT